MFRVLRSFLRKSWFRKTQNKLKPEKYHYTDIQSTFYMTVLFRQTGEIWNFLKELKNVVDTLFINILRLLTLRNQGYIKIQDGYDTSPSRKKTKNTSYCFIRVKDYDENNYIERIVFEGLFASNKNFANSTTLGETFSHKLNKAIDTKYKPTKKNEIGKASCRERV